MSPAELLDQLRFARFYTGRLIDATPLTDWSRVPPGGTSHVTWQVGHLAVAAYSLALARQRGERPEDEALLGAALRAAFGRTSAPAADGPSAEEALAAYRRVHARVEEEWPEFTRGSLDEPLDRPHLICKTRRDCLAWAARHELVHAGQIGLLRRQLGHSPLW